MPPNEERWDARLEELRKFRREHGHCDVPFKHGGLGRWVENQRHARRQGKGWLDARRIRKLDEEGFRWSVNEDKWDARLEELKEFRREHGHCDVPQKRPGGLGLWVRNQRLRKGLLDARRIRLLEEEGFQWQVGRGHGGHDDRWDARLEELREFRREHGHCDVPQRRPGGLGLWVRNQRKARKQGKGWLDTSRIRLLEDEGFKWRTGSGHVSRRAAAGGLGGNEQEDGRGGDGAAGRSAPEKEREAGAKANAALEARQTVLEQSLAAKHQELASKEKEIVSRDEANAALKAQQTVLEQSLAAKDKKLASKETEIASRDEAIAALEARQTVLEQSLAAKDQELVSKETEIASRDEAIAAVEARRTVSLKALNETLMTKKREIDSLTACLKRKRQVDIVDFTLDETEPNKRPHTDTTAKSSLAILHKQNQKMIEIKREKNAAETTLKNVREEKAAVEADLNEAREQNQKMVEIKREKNATETTLMSVREEKAAVEADLQEVKDNLGNANTLLHEILKRDVL